MKKAEFIGYLYALKDLAVDDTFDDFDDGVEWVLDKIIERAKDLDEPMQNSPGIPVTPPYSPTVPWNPWNPWNPSTTSILYTSNNIELDNCEEMEYNGIRIKKDPTLPDPNDWSIEQNTPGRPDFTVVK